ncbi:MAG: hypothetical protein ACFHWX_09205 [Bacteroidota bacterium]
MRSLPALFSILLLSHGCAPVSSDKEAASDTVSARADAVTPVEREIAEQVEIQPDKPSVDSVSVNMKPALIDLFEDPIDVLAYKIKKEGANGSAMRKRNYFHQPDTVGNYFMYFWFYTYRRNASVPNAQEAVILNTYIYGETIGQYEKVDEALISIKGMVNDPDLDRLNVVGLTKQEVIDQFGLADFSDQNLYVYEHMKDILILHFEDDQVDWFNFLRTNLDLTSMEDLPPELKYYNEHIPVNN